MNDEPSPTADNGRKVDGTFAPGNRAGKGNPFAKRVSELRAALFEAVSPADLKAVVLKLAEQAKAGDVASIRELLQRLLGPPESADLMERLDTLETKIEQLAESRAR